jgi:hypothetical protein
MRNGKIKKQNSRPWSALLLFIIIVCGMGSVSLTNLKYQLVNAQECEWWNVTCSSSENGGGSSDTTSDSSDTSSSGDTATESASEENTGTDTTTDTENSNTGITTPNYCYPSSQSCSVSDVLLYDDGSLLCDASQGTDCSQYLNPPAPEESLQLGDTTTNDSVICTQADDNTTVCPITIVGDKPNDDPCAPDHIPQPKPFSYDPDVNVISHYTENWNGQITKDWLTTNCFSSSGTAYPQTWVHPSGKRIVLLSDSSSQPADSQQPSTEDPIITEIKIYASECNAQKTELINTSDQLKASGSGSPNYATEYNELANSFNKFSSEMYEVTYPRVVELEKERDTVDPNMLPIFDENIRSVKNCKAWLDEGGFSQLFSGLASPP